MVSPTRVGAAFGSNSGVATVTLTNPSGATTGDRVIAYLSHTGTAATITDLQGWTVLNTLTFNTRKWYILERSYAASYPALTLSTTEGVFWAVVAIRATSGYTLGATTLGATWRRVDNGGSINTTQAPSMSTTADSLSVAFFSETSTAAETEAQTTLSGTGWTKWFWSKATAGDANPVNFLAYRDGTGSASGVATTTWPNNSNNGAGVQMLVPQTSTGPGATGNLDTVGIYQHSATSLTVGARQVTAGVVQAILKRAGTEVDRKTITLTSGRGFAAFTGLLSGTDYTASFEVNGVTQTDVQVAGRTLRTGPSSFTVVTGSCMFTGSTHPVYDRILEDNPDFWTIQGDIHYQDSTDAAGWWSGMVTSLNALRALPRKIATRWTPDNHDTIRTTPLGGGAPELPPIWKQISGSSDWASSDSIGQAWQNGRVLFIQADLRSARDNYAVPDPSPLKMLGTDQKTWFKNLLTAAETDPNITMVIWFDNWIGLQQGSGRWGSYPEEYAELNSHIQSLPKVKSRMVLIGGDSHNLWADSGARSWPEAAFPGIPSLNISGYNRASPAETFYVPDIASDTIQSSGVEADWGSYSRIKIQDSGGDLTFTWDGIKVDSAGTPTTMATWSKTYSASSNPQPWSAVYVGGTQASAVYVGTNKVWP